LLPAGARKNISHMLKQQQSVRDSAKAVICVQRARAIVPYAVSIPAATTKSKQKRPHTVAIFV
jgi:hypothetical protein